MAYNYGAKEPEKLKIEDMTARQKELLIDSDRSIQRRTFKTNA